LDAAFAVRGVTYLVYMTRPANAATIKGIFQIADQTSGMNPGFGAVLVDDPASLSQAYASLLEAGDASVDCVLIARMQPVDTAGRRIDTYSLAAVDDSEEMVMAWTRDV